MGRHGPWTRLERDSVAPERWGRGQAWEENRLPLVYQEYLGTAVCEGKGDGRNGPDFTGQERLLEHKRPEKMALSQLQASDSWD